jgi:alternate signal-mediated exported protein
MKKFNKKAIIGLVASAALLGGTAGTFALWFDSAALAADVNAISTGNLAVAGSDDGSWVWTNTSTPVTGLIGTAVGSNDLLVPGDAVTWNFDLSGIDPTLKGSTIVANLYLDGLGYITGADITPLVVQVNGQGIAAGTIVLANLNAESTFEDVVLNLPTVLLGFPVAGTAQAPTAALDGYGRSQTIEAFNPSDLSIRLQQVVDSDTAFTVDNG